MNIRRLVPEVVQTSAMDCGPASLKCVLEGMNIPVSYGRLREACQTDVDGTSIDTLEEIARQLGLDAEQVMIPREHVLLTSAEALPAIVVQRMPNGMTHFVVAWSILAGRVQLMDPGTGRRWPSRAQFLESLYEHATVAPAAAFRDWAETADFLEPLAHRLALLGVPYEGRAQREHALDDPSWRSLAALDAATRLVESLASSGGISRGAEATRVLDAMFERSRNLLPGEAAPIPARYWYAEAAASDEDGTENVTLRGAVLVRVRGRQSAEARADHSPLLSSELAAALAEPADQSWRTLLRMFREDGLLSPLVLTLSVLLAACGVIVEALLYWGVVQIGDGLALAEDRLAGSVALALFLLFLLALELPLAAGVLRAGRHLELRLRVAFLEKLPRLADRYFSSRPISDMAQRCHSAHTLRAMPMLGAQLLRAFFGLLATASALLWLDPASSAPVLLLTATAIALPAGINRVLVERDLRVRTHVGALSRFYLDALLGLLPIRAHTAERATRREHESLLGEWAIAGRELLRASIFVQGFYATCGLVIAAWLVFAHVAESGAHPQTLLIAYWAFGLLARGQELSSVLQLYPAQRNTTLRLLEPLGAPDDAPAAHLETPQKSASASPVRLTFEEVAVHAGGHAILEDLSVDIEPGSHVAIVGSSGAGKSSFVGLLLGWHRPSSGRVLIDGVPLDGAGLDRLRSEIAWVDPAVQLWNRSFLDNLRYGITDPSVAPSEVVAEAELYGVLERLPDGQQTVLGEGGGLVSGGEGQRVRLGRAMLRPNARLVLLDEPFRGLDRDRRHSLLLRARNRWRGATMLCVTHDVGETVSFERVLVIEGGHIVEDGVPAELSKRTGSRYRALLDAEDVVRNNLWSNERWRQVTIEDGKLR